MARTLVIRCELNLRRMENEMEIILWLSVMILPLLFMPVPIKYYYLKVSSNRWIFKKWLKIIKLHNDNAATNAVEI